MERLLQPVRNLLRPGAFATCADQELLTRFVDAQDQDAFTELLRRHATMVWRVCHSVLPHPDAEEAFQATFVVMAKNCRELRGATLAAWLYRVAHRLSVRQWKKLRRLGFLPLTQEPPARAEDGLIALRELQTVLSAELAELPEKYRVPILLCGVEELTKAEAAVRLDIPEGTVSSRLATGRDMLRERLTRRGFELPLMLTTLGLVSSASAKSVQQAADMALQTIPLSLRVTQLLASTLSGFLTIKTTVIGGTMSAFFLTFAWLITVSPAAKHEDKPTVAAVGKEVPPEAPPVIKHVDQDGDPLPPESLMRFGTTRYRKSEGFRLIALAQDGKRLASMGSAGTFIWDLATGQVVQQFPPVWHNDEEQCKLAFINDDKYLAVSSKCQRSNAITEQPKIEEGEVARVWDIATGKMLKLLINKSDPTHSGPGGLWSIDGGKKFITVSSYKPKRDVPCTTMIVWDAVTLQELERHTYPIVSSRVLDYSGTQDCFLCLRNPDSNAIPFAPNRDHSLIVLNRKSGQVLWSSTDQDWLEAKARFSPDGTQVLLLREDKLELLTVATKKRETLDVKMARWNLLPVFQPHGESMLFTQQSQLFELSLKPGAKPEKKFPLQNRFDFQILPGGKQILGKDRNDVLRQFDLTTGKEQERAKNYRVVAKAASQSRGNLIAMTDIYGQVDLWDMRERKLVRNLRPCHDRKGQPAHDLKFSPDDRILASASTAGVIDLWSMPNGELLHSISLDKGDKEQAEGADHIQFSSDGKLLYFLPRDRPAGCIDVKTGKNVELGELWREFGMIIPKSQHVLMPKGICDLTTGETVRAIGFPVQKPWDLFRGNMSADGSRFCLIKNVTFEVYDLATQNRLMSAEPSKRFSIQSVKLHPDGKWVTTFMDDGTLRTWEVATGEQVHEIHGLNYHVWNNMILGPRGLSALPLNDMAPLLYSLRPLDTPKGFSTALWEQLAAQPKVAFRAEWAMLDHPDKTVALLREKLKVTPTKREKNWFNEQVKLLDSDTFALREAASKVLIEAIGEIPHAWIEDVLKTTASEEVKAKMKELSERHPARIRTEVLRLNRAIQVLELLDTPDAVKLLEEWSKSESITELNKLAQQSLKRQR